MATALYRLSSNEVLKVSTQDQSFSDADVLFFGVAISPATPDGTLTRENLPDGTLGPLRQLGFAKHYVSGTNTVRNATQLEIDTYAAAELDDDNQQDAIRAKDLLDTHPQFRKILVAMADILKDEINILRALHALPDRTLAQFKTAMSNRVSKND